MIIITEKLSRICRRSLVNRSEVQTHPQIRTIAPEPIRFPMARSLKKPHIKPITALTSASSSIEIHSATGISIFGFMKLPVVIKIKANQMITENTSQRITAYFRFFLVEIILMPIKSHLFLQCFRTFHPCFHPSGSRLPLRPCLRNLLRPLRLKAFLRQQKA